MPPAWPMSSTVASAKWRCLITRLNRSGAWVPGLWDAEREHRRSGGGRLVLVAADEPGRVVAFIDLEPDGHIDPQR